MSERVPLVVRAGIVASFPLMLVLATLAQPAAADGAPDLRRYEAVVTDCYDADTCTVEVNLGFGVWLYGQRVRLYGINAPEMRGPEKAAGKVARDWVRTLVKGKRVTLAIIQKRGRDAKGKFGRWLAVLELADLNVNDALVANGYAKLANY